MLAPSLSRCLAGRTHGGERDDIDVRASQLSLRCRAFSQSFKNGFEAIMNSLSMKMVCFGGG